MLVSGFGSYLVAVRTGGGSCQALTLRRAKWRIVRPNIPIMAGKDEY